MAEYRRGGQLDQLKALNVIAGTVPSVRVTNASAETPPTGYDYFIGIKAQGAIITFGAGCTALEGDAPANTETLAENDTLYGLFTSLTFTGTARLYYV